MTLLDRIYWLKRKFPWILPLGIIASAFILSYASYHVGRTLQSIECYKIRHADKVLYEEKVKIETQDRGEFCKKLGFTMTYPESGWEGVME